MSGRMVFVGLMICLGQTASAQDSWHWTINHDFLNPSGINAMGNNAPFFSDIDGDGDRDLIIGQYGRIELFYNEGFPQNPYWRRDTTCFGGLHFAQAAIPCLGDFDQDGTVELVVSQNEWGHPSDSLRVYHNIGTPQQPVWAETTGYFNFTTAGYSFQRFFDWDGDGDFDLILGRPWDQPTPQYWFMRNQGYPGNPDWQVDSVLSAAFPSEVCSNEGFAIADFNLDGLNDIIYSFTVCDDGSGVCLSLNQGTNTNPVYDGYTQYVTRPLRNRQSSGCGRYGRRQRSRSNHGRVVSAFILL